MADLREPNFGESIFSGGDSTEIKTADFLSASRSNNDLKDMLQNKTISAKKVSQ